MKEVTADWLVPDWPAPPGVKGLFTTRSGGVSAPPFDSLNLGDHVRDEPAAVAANRERLRLAAGARPVFLNQVHGLSVAQLDEQIPDGFQADACVGSRTGVVCTVMVADCLPVLWCRADGRQVAASHAGWRGLAGEGGRGILEATLEAMRHAALPSEGATDPGDLLVWLGPCIGPRAFEVGAEVRAAFVAHDAAAQSCFVVHGPGKYLADLPALARLRLKAMGVSRIHGNDGSDAWCTFTDSSRFFSHRRDASRLGSTGRMAACIWKT